jgi:sugar phosphate permease
VDIVPEGEGMLSGVVTSVTFMGVHNEIIVDIGGFKWMIQTTDEHREGEKVGLYIEPDAIHIMKKSEYSGLYGDYSSYSEEIDLLSVADYVEEDVATAESENEMAEIVKEKGALYPFLHLIRNKTFLVWTFVVFASGIARYGLVTWIPKYLSEVAGLGDIVGLLTSTILPIGMGIGTLIVPTLTDKFCPNNRLLASVVSGLGAAICVVGFMLLKPTGFQFILMMVCLFFAGFFIYAINGIVWAYAADVGGRIFASTAAGILDFAAYMGAAIQSMLYGFILSNGNWNVVFLSVAVFCFLIALISFISSPKKA